MEGINHIFLVDKKKKIVSYAILRKECCNISLIQCYNHFVVQQRIKGVKPILIFFQTMVSTNYYIISLFCNKTWFSDMSHHSILGEKDRMTIYFNGLLNTKIWSDVSL